MFLPTHKPIIARRTSVLSPTQWDEVRQRYLDGETAAALALEFGVSAAAIRTRFSRK